MFSYSNYIIYDFFSLCSNPDSVTKFIPNTLLRLWEKWHIFYFIFIIYTYWIFVKRDKPLSKLIQSKYGSIKIKKECPAELFNHHPTIKIFWSKEDSERRCKIHCVTVFLILIVKIQIVTRIAKQRNEYRLRII
jgi:hypothetical protein